MISEFALFVFTTLGGMGAGLYASAAVFPVKGKRNNVLVPAVALALLVIGCLALLTHLGRPERIFNSLTNLSAGITLEAFSCLAFGLVAIIDIVIAAIKGATPRALRYVGGILAVVLCGVMGIAYYGYESILAWHALPTVPFFLCVDLAIGLLLLGALSVEATEKKAFSWVCIVLAALAAVIFAAEGIVFVTLGYNIVPFLCAAVFALAAVAAVFYAGKKSNARMYLAAFAFMLIATVVARYAFYGII